MIETLISKTLINIPFLLIKEDCTYYLVIKEVITGIIVITLTNNDYDFNDKS